MGGRLKASLALGAMFGLGLVAGTALQTYRFEHFRLHHGYVAQRIEYLNKELHLTPQQEAAIRDVFSKAHDRAQQVNEEVAWDLSDIHRDSVRSIRALLTPEQVHKFDRIHQHSHALVHHRVKQEEGGAAPVDDLARRPNS